VPAPRRPTTSKRTAAGARRRDAAEGEPCLLVLADEPLQMQALRCLLERAARVDTTAAASLSDVPDLVRRTGARVVVWLTEAVDREGLTEVAEIRRCNTDVGFCILARRVDPVGLGELLAAAPGSVAVLLRDTAPDVRDLLVAVRQVARGQVVMGGRVMEEVLSVPLDGDDRLANLSGREREVLELLASGLRNREIARRLARSEKLVEKHVQHVFAKLGLDPVRRAQIDRRVTAARIYLSAAQTGDDERPPEGRSES
jgi:DNA-binding NarL/FixJ family response regulator